MSGAAPAVRAVFPTSLAVCVRYSASQNELRLSSFSYAFPQRSRIAIFIPTDNRRRGAMLETGNGMCQYALVQINVKIRPDYPPGVNLAIVDLRQISMPNPQHRGLYDAGGTN